MLTGEKRNFVRHRSINAAHARIVSMICIKMKGEGGALARGQAYYDIECSISDMNALWHLS